jgi:hypothetical protein
MSFSSQCCAVPCASPACGPAVALTCLLWTQVQTACTQHHWQQQLCVAYQDYHQLAFGAVSATAGVGSGRAYRTCLRRTRGLPHSCLPPGIRSPDLWPWLSSLSKAPNPAVFGRGGGKGFRMLLAHRLRWCFPRTPCQQRCWRTCHGGTPRTVALALSLHQCGSDTGRWAAHTKLPTSMGKIRGCQCVHRDVCRLATQRAQEAHSCSRTKKKKLVQGNAGYAAQH